MVAILYPRRLRNLLDVTQPQGTGLPDGGIPVLASSNSSFVIETHGGGGPGGSFSLGASNIGNTLGDTGVTGTRVVLAGIGNLTLSQATDANGGTISISGGTAGAGGVAISASNSLFSTGTVVLSGAGGGATVNTNGGTIQISVAAPVAQSVQTQNRFNLTLDGNTAGALQEVSSGTLTLAGGNGITLSQNGNAVTISGNTFSQSVQPETQTFIGGISASNTLYTSGTVRITGAGNITIASGTGQQVIVSGSQSVQPETQTFIGGVIASNTTYTSGSVRFTGVGGGVTVSSNTGQRVDISVAAQSVQTQNMVAVTLSGNTSGAQALISSGTLTLAGGNNITVSQNGNAVTISGPNVGGAQTGISGIIASDATYTSGTVQFTGSNMITVKSSANQRVVIDATQSVQPGIQNLIASDATFSSGTVSISGFGAATVNTAANLIRISVPVQSVQPETQTFIGGIANTETTYTSGTVKFLELGAVTVRSTTGNQFQISVNSQTVQTQSLFSAGVSTGGNTAGDTGVTGTRMVFVGTNNITLSQATAAAGGTITISGPTTAAQTVQTQGILSAGVTNAGNTQGNTQVSTGSRLVLVGTNNITLSQGTAAGATTISISGAPSFSGGVSNLGNTGGATGVSGTRLVLVGSNNVTLSQTTDASGATVSLFGQAPAGGAFSAGASNLGNTAGATGISGTQMVLVGSGVMSLSQTTGANGNTVSVLAPAQSVLSAVAPLSTSTNGSTISFLGPASSSIVGTSGISISTAGSTISVMQTSGGPGWLESWFPHSVAPHTSGAQGQGTLHVQPMPLPNDIRMDRILVPTWISNATNSSNSISVSQYVGFYTRNASTLSLVTSVSTSTNFSGSGTVGSYSLYGGRRWQSMALTTTLSSGDFWIGIIMRTTTGGGAGHTVGQELMTQFSNATFSGWSGVLGAATNASMQYQKGLGTYTATTNALPSAIPFASLTGTGTLVMNVPIYALVSGTV